MRGAMSERMLVAVVAMAAVIGIGVDRMVDDVPAKVEVDIARAEAPFVSRAVFCPPPFSRDKSSMSIAAFSDPGVEATVGIEPADGDNIRLRADRMMFRSVEGPAPGIVGYGARMHAAALLSADRPVQGSDAARCAGISSNRWFFGEGSSLLGYDERLLIRNPFPEEAVVSVGFYTPSGKTTRANLGEIAVSAGETRFVKVNDFIAEQPVLGASIEVERGRVVAWRAMFAVPEDRPAGVQYTLGATQPETEWFFPEGAVGTGITEQISLLNPQNEGAVVSVSLLTSRRTVQPPRLVEVRIPPESLKVLSLPDVLGARDQDLGAVATVIRSTNQVGVVAERTVWYAAGRTGVASEIGANETFPRWIVPPAAVSSIDDSLVVANPGAENGRISVMLLRQEGGPVRPARLQDLRVKGGTRVRLVLNDFTGGAPVTAVVRSSVRIVAERVASTGNGDVSSVMGFGLRPTGR